jgi:hypothetical protein
MAFDSGRAVIVLHGGSGPAVNYESFDDTWEWDGTDWREAASLVAAPPNSLHRLVHDPVRRRTVAFGGFDLNFGRDDTWAYVLAAHAPAVQSFGVGCAGGSGAPPRLQAAPRELPWTGEEFAVTIDRTPPHTPCFLVSGFSDRWFGSLPLPVELSLLRMPGCWLYTEMFATSLAFADGSGEATAAVFAPAAPALVGTRFFQQAVVFDAAANLGAFTTSNALASVVGAY